MYIHKKGKRSNKFELSWNKFVIQKVTNLTSQQYFVKYWNNPKYCDRHICAHSVDQDQTPHNAASDMGLHCLPLIQQEFRHINRY